MDPLDYVNIHLSAVAHFSDQFYIENKQIGYIYEVFKAGQRLPDFIVKDVTGSGTFYCGYFF